MKPTTGLCYHIEECNATHKVELKEGVSSLVCKGLGRLILNLLKEEFDRVFP